MFKVLVAEDERPISRNICKTIEKLNNKFCVVKAVYNGKTAIDYLDNNDVDVAFLDINMPMYNGLQVLEHVSKEKIDTICVMLTGYQEFNYAQQAIRGNAFDYLTKPLEKDKLGDLLEKLQLDLERKYRETILNSKLEVPHTIFESNIAFKDRCYLGCVLLCNIKNQYYLTEAIEQLQNDEEKLINTLDEWIGTNSYWLAPGHELGEKYLFIMPSAKEKLVITDNVEKLLTSKGCYIGINISKNTIGIEEVQKTYYDLKDELKRLLRYNNSIVVKHKKSISGKQLNTKDLDEKMKCLVSTSTYTQVKECLNECIELCEYNRDDIKLVCKCFFANLCKKLPSNVNYFDIEKDILEVLDNTNEIKLVFDGLENLLNDNFYFQVNQAENKNDLALQIHEYIEKNYQYFFSNKLLSDKFGFVPFYLRRIFKEVYGMSPNEYMLQYRMKKAKEFLLNGMHAKDVAELIGFKDPLYFSKVFKKEVGMTTTQYVASYNK